MSSALLAVKFFIPTSRPNLTDRPQLLDRFTAGLGLPLTLISAPAGFGKSTLLSAWINRQTSGKGRPAPAGILSWLSLDAADNKSSRFWIYFVAAIQMGLKHQGWDPGSASTTSLDHLLEFLQSDPPPSIQTILDELINVLTSLSERVLLVLDDYHEIQQPLIQEQMTYLLDHQPPNLHLVIATRADPPLPITRLRARGQLSEFRASDLRFTPAEVTEFFKATISQEVSREDLNAIQSSTEGWIAGLQMAALALQAQISDPGDNQQAGEKIHQFINTFSGKNTYVLDYLADEVFNRQTEDVQSFLLKTSSLDRFCAGLCDRLIQQPEKADPQLRDRSPSSIEILSYLEKTNLFLIALDHDRQWFRYHHLFTDLLRVRLEQTWPDLKNTLFVRAAGWYEEAGRMEEAIHYAVLGQDWERAAAMMEHETQGFLEKGQLSKVIEWIALLPKEVSSQRIWLLFQQAYVMGLAHRMKEFMPLLAAEEQALERVENTQSLPLEEATRLRCNLLFQKGYVAIAQNNPQQAMQLALEGLRILPPESPWEESWLLWTKAYANRSLNHLSQAVEGFQEAFQATQKHKNLWTDMVCLTDLAMVYHLLGDLTQARDIYLRALDLGSKRGAAGHSYLNRVEGWLSLILIERNEIETAGKHARTGIELSQYWPSTNARSVSFIALAQLEMAKGNLDAAGEWLEQAEKERQKSPLMPVNNSLLDYNLVRFWLARSDIETAVRWAQPFRESWKTQDPDAILSENVEQQWIALARILIALGRSGEPPALAEAVELLNRIERSARGSGRVNSLVEVGVLQAVALHLITMTMEKSVEADSTALQALDESLAAAEPGGYLRMFVNEGPLMASLLKALRSHSQNHTYHRSYLDKLIETISPSETSQSQKVKPNLPESLTDREMDVLRLMVSGLSNKDLAEKLVLSEGTIKTHIHNIMGKLDAQSRTQAIALAREFGIL